MWGRERPCLSSFSWLLLARVHPPPTPHRLLSSKNHTNYFTLEQPPPFSIQYFIFTHQVLTGFFCISSVQWFTCCSVLFCLEGVEIKHNNNNLHSFSEALLEESSTLLLGYGTWNVNLPGSFSNFSFQRSLIVIRLPDANRQFPKVTRK